MRGCADCISLGSRSIEGNIRLRDPHSDEYGLLTDGAVQSNCRRSGRARLQGLFQINDHSGTLFLPFEEVRIDRLHE